MEKKQRHFIKSDKMIARTSTDSLEATINKNAITFDTFVKSNFVSPKPQEPSIINSADGKITRIFLTIPKYALENPYWNVYAALIKQLPSYTKFLILTHESIENELKRWLLEHEIYDRVELASVPNHLHFSVWAEDAYAVTKDETNQTFFVEPYSFPRYADSLMSKFASNVSDLKNYQTPLYFQGGNILIGDDFFFIGEDYPNNSLEYVNKVIIPDEDESPEELVKRLYTEYLDSSKKLFYIGSNITVPHQIEEEFEIEGEKWRQIYYFGNKKGTVQPLFHIDMFLTLVGRKEGKYQILVGDPEMGSDLINFPESKKYSMKDIFDNIADQLSRNEEFEIIRNPLPLVYVDDDNEKIRYWYFATSNNCLVENCKESKTVWLPTYGHGNWKVLKITDERNQEIWEKLGFTVNLLPDFHPFAENLGAVHCIKKYLGRELN